MRKLLIALLILSCYTLNGQSTKEKFNLRNPYRSVPQLQLVQNFDSSLLIGTYYTGLISMEGYETTLNADGTFTDSSFNCDGKKLLKSGYWQHSSSGQILIGNSTCEFVKYEFFTFLLSVKSRKRFIKEFSAALKEAKKYEAEESSYFPGGVVTSMNVMYPSKKN